MKLNRFASALTVSALLLSMCGCQNNSNTYTEILSEEEIAARYTTTTTATSEAVIMQTSENTSVTTTEIIIEPVAYSPSEEILNADIYSGKVQIEDKVYTFPLSVQKLLDEGMVITDNEIGENYLIEPRSTKKSLNVAIGNVNASINVVNTADELTSLKNCYASSIEFRSFESVFYPNGITAGSTLDELKEKWGAPYSESSPSDSKLKYTYIEYPFKTNRAGTVSSDLISVTENVNAIVIDRNTGLVTSIFCSNGNNNDTLIEKNRVISDKTIIYSVPAYLDDNYCIVEADNNKYVLRLDEITQGINNFEPNNWKDNISEFYSNYSDTVSTLKHFETDDNTAHVVSFKDKTMGNSYMECNYAYYICGLPNNYRFTFQVAELEQGNSVFIMTDALAEKLVEIILEIGKTITIE